MPSLGDQHRIPVSRPWPDPDLDQVSSWPPVRRAHRNVVAALAGALATVSLLMWAFSTL